MLFLLKLGAKIHTLTPSIVYSTLSSNAMKKYLYLLVLLIVSHVAFTQNCGCDHTISQSGIVKADDYNYKPGDVFCITAGKYGFFRFIGFEGTKNNPLIFKNCGGKVVIDDDKYAGIEFQHSKYIRCTDSSGFQGKFLLENLNFHHNYIHDINGEGFYVGYTGNYEEGKTNACPDKILFGHDVQHVKIHHNKLVNIGWDGIQVSLGTEDVEVYDNYLENPGKNDEPVQNSGIQFGSGTVGKIYNNTIIGGTNNGITNFGLGPVYIYNNLIVNAGARGIYNDHQKSLPPGNGYYIANNTIISPKTHGIFYINGVNLLESPFECYNNLIVNPGVFDQIASLPSHWSVASIHAYVGYNTETLYLAHKSGLKKNHFVRNINNPKFIDASNDDYNLASNSPVIDGGTNQAKTLLGFDTDITGYTRKGNFDIGAYEFRDELSAAEDDIHFSKNISLFPNPISHNEDCFLKLEDINSGKYTISLVPLDGKEEIILHQNLSLKSGNQKINLGSKLSPGVYLVKVVGDGFFQTLKLQIL